MHSISVRKAVLEDIFHEIQCKKKTSENVMGKFFSHVSCKIIIAASIRGKAMSQKGDLVLVSVKIMIYRIMI